MECIVIDNGSALTKVGFSGEDSPISAIPTVVGKEVVLTGFGALTNLRSRKGRGADLERNGCFVGKSALSRSDQLKLEKPIKRGVVDDWDSIKRIWEHAFEHELQVDPENYPILLTDAPMNPKSDREKIAQIVFEDFNSPGVYIISESVLSLFSTGRTRGIVVGSGSEVSSVVPVFEGFSLPHAMKKLDFAGEDLTSFFHKLLGSNNLPRETVEDMKERSCSVSQKRFSLREGRRSSSSGKSVHSSSSGDIRREDRGDLGFRDRNTVSYELPDGQIVEVNENCQHGVPESLFDPSMSGSASRTGIAHLTFQSILACDKTFQKDLLGSIVLAGGSTLFPGFGSRLESEIMELSSASQVTVVSDSKRKNAAWIGGSMFASLETFPQIFVSRAEWEENGSRIIHQKCL